MDFSTILNYLINHLDFIISLCSAVAFLVVNIIQAVRSHDKSKLKEVILDIPNIIREVEKLSTDDNGLDYSGYFACTTTIAKNKSMFKKALSESLLIAKYGEKFVNKHIGVLDDSIEDILNTPQKKGGSYELSKKDEER